MNVENIMPDLPEFMHDIISHAWPLVFLLLILVIGKKFFKDQPKARFYVVLAFIPLVVWGPDLFRLMDSLYGRREGKIYTYMSNDFREFTDMNGRTMKATILDVTANSVVVRRSDGRIFENRISLYSSKDQKYIVDWKSRQ